MNPQPPMCYSCSEAPIILIFSAHQKLAPSKLHAFSLLCMIRHLCVCMKLFLYRDAARSCCHGHICFLRSWGELQTASSLTAHLYQALPGRHHQTISLIMHDQAKLTQAQSIDRHRSLTSRTCMIFSYFHMALCTNISNNKLFTIKFDASQVCFCLPPFLNICRFEFFH
jgi:hypothetical protein